MINTIEELHTFIGKEVYYVIHGNFITANGKDTVKEITKMGLGVGSGVNVMIGKDKSYLLREYNVPYAGFTSGFFATEFEADLFIKSNFKLSDYNKSYIKHLVTEYAKKYPDNNITYLNFAKDPNLRFGQQMINILHERDKEIYDIYNEAVKRNVVSDIWESNDNHYCYGVIFSLMCGEI